MSWKYCTQTPQSDDVYIWIDSRNPTLTDTFTTDPMYQQYTSPIQLIGGCSTTIPWTTR